MTEANKGSKKCSGRGKIMFIYGFTQLGSNLISAIALAAIAFSLCSLKKEAQLFNDCVNVSTEELKSSSKAVNFCNGGK